jgi:uncharacterized protein with NRDE domain
MCLALLAWHSLPDYPLVLVSNRDEFYARRTRPAAWWGQAVAVLGGQDDEAGGTWLAINRRGRFSLVTNVRAPSERNPHAPSRGSLVVAALQAGPQLAPWLDDLAPRTGGYNGFNLLAGDVVPGASSLHYFSNRSGQAPRALAPGVYGLSNAFLDTPWPKLTRSMAAFATAVARRVEVADLLHLMADRRLARDHELPATGVPPEWERALSAVQIRANGYGTRATTVLTVRRDGLVGFFERSFGTDDPEQHQDRHYEFMIDAVQPAVRPSPRDR